MGAALCEPRQRLTFPKFNLLGPGHIPTARQGINTWVKMRRRFARPVRNQTALGWLPIYPSKEAVFQASKPPSPLKYARF